ncbi:helix-turn-helix domain-containing protein [Streptomyces sp. XY332]|uniref:AraC-like ligand-binding domain-containing protein n=1 Tax=Streptomyces sp. XY332 TaxID=1415561 RepID=UPI0006B21D07|nr:helix-turn-helix domain-containing protein [Streptomyces sp. XY332]KOY54152.1 AraC family transcriptional regulator [Streptomyces sp. XY332]
MGLTVFDTADLPPEHRFEWWRETVSRGAGATLITADRPADFAGSMGVLPLGPVQVATVSFPAMSSERTDRLIRRSDPETYELTLILRGSMQVSQADRQARLAAGDFNLWSSSFPSGSRSAGGREGVPAAPSDALILHLPRTLVPLPEAKVNRLLARGLPAGTGVAAILARHLTSVVEEAEHLDEGDGNRLGALTSDLATALLARHLDAADLLPPHTRQQVLLSRIDTFIEDNLADPELSPRTVAARHHISVRLLHRLFAAREESVSATIRRLRLERCSADLVDPRLVGTPVHAVGARWGFADAAAFSRTFRAAYGISPRDHRHGAPTARVGRTRPAGQTVGHRR